MKKLLLMLFAVFAVVACGEKKSDKRVDSANEVSADLIQAKCADSAKEAVAFLEKMYNQLSDETPDGFIATAEESLRVYDALSQVEQKAWDDAADKWTAENPQKMESIQMLVRFLVDNGLMELF